MFFRRKWSGKPFPMPTFESMSSQMVSAEEALDILENRSHEVESVEFEPPVLGKDGFGKFRVKWKIPHYRVQL